MPDRPQRRGRPHPAVAVARLRAAAQAGPAGAWVRAAADWLAQGHRALVALAATVAVVLTGGVTLVGTGALASGSTRAADPGVVVGGQARGGVGGVVTQDPQGGQPSTSPAPLSQATLPPLSRQLDPDVLVTAPAPLTDEQVAAAVAAGGITDWTEASSGQVHLGNGTTQALGVDPAQFRTYTPANTATSQPLWQSVARGDAAVAHAVATALAVPLGGTVGIGAGPVAASVRVGALATTNLPGVGVVVDGPEGSRIGLVPNSALVLVAAGKDPVTTAALVSRALGDGVTVTPLRIPTVNGRAQWVAPAVGPITQTFGPHAGATESHPGIDIGAPLNSPIYAASAGTVTYAGPASGFGNEIIVTHAGGVSTVYGHMKIILAKAGTQVTAGQPIALVGDEGESTGPHLHFEVHLGSQLTDPLAWLKSHGVTVAG
ncbi:MAG TPA: M23 family metallopeptidase [Frankiaceae bacterium]